MLLKKTFVTTISAGKPDYNAGPALQCIVGLKLPQKKGLKKLVAKANAVKRSIGKKYRPQFGSDFPFQKHHFKVVVPSLYLSCANL